MTSDELNLSIKRSDLKQDEPRFVEEHHDGRERSMRYIGSATFQGHRVEFIEMGWKHEVSMLDTSINAYVATERENIRKPMSSISNVTYTDRDAVDDKLVLGIDTSHAYNTGDDLGERFTDALRQITEVINETDNYVQCLRCDRFFDHHTHGEDVTLRDYTFHVCPRCRDYLIDETDKTTD
jgi:hypothetical protein